MSAPSHFRSKQEHCRVLQNFSRVLNEFLHFSVLAGKQRVLSQVILTSLEKKMCYQSDVKNYLQTRGANQLESKIKNSDGIKNNVNKEVHVNTERRLNNSA